MERKFSLENFKKQWRETEDTQEPFNQDNLTLQDDPSSADDTDVFQKALRVSSGGNPQCQNSKQGAMTHPQTLELAEVNRLKGSLWEACATVSTRMDAQRMTNEACKTEKDPMNVVLRQKPVEGGAGHGDEGSGNKSDLTIEETTPEPENVPDGKGDAKGIAEGLEGDKKMRRVLSNRASARRSRMRKQEQLGNLENRATMLQAENSGLRHQLSELSKQYIASMQDNRSLVQHNQQLYQHIRMLEGSPVPMAFQEQMRQPCGRETLEAFEANAAAMAAANLQAGRRFVAMQQQPCNTHDERVLQNSDQTMPTFPTDSSAPDGKLGQGKKKGQKKQ